MKKAISIITYVKIAVFWLTLGGLLSISAQASDYHSPRTTGLGGAGHAYPLLNDAIYLNPSFCSFQQTYSVSANYFWYAGSTQQLSEIKGHGLNASIQDGRSPLFQAGVGITQYESYRILHVGASKGLLNELGVGIGGKFLFPMNENPLNPSLQDGTASVTWTINPWLLISTIIDNLLETPEGVLRGDYREIILGTRTNVQNIFQIYFDPHWVPAFNDSAYGHETGVEFTLMQDFLLRFGVHQNSKIPFAQTRGNGWGLGVSWAAPRISFDYGYSKVTSPVTATYHILGLNIFF